MCEVMSHDYNNKSFHVMTLEVAELEHLCPDKQSRPILITGSPRPIWTLPWTSNHKKYPRIGKKHQHCSFVPVLGGSEGSARRPCFERTCRVPRSTLKPFIYARFMATTLNRNRKYCGTFLSAGIFNAILLFDWTNPRLRSVKVWNWGLNFLNGPRDWHKNSFNEFTQQNQIKSWKNSSSGMLLAKTTDIYWM